MRTKYARILKLFSRLVRTAHPTFWVFVKLSCTKNFE
ncbi:Uncharacterised protein [Alysiella crassa]|uniref:Uncharacterized protein n=1 Tax=Alysiella crassa TaxID=153491 RepID=A0A376BMF7_9NEIS|nr:Uncharacterised protein [Alysiella crassa]